MSEFDALPDAEQVDALVNEAASPKTFSFLEVLQGRKYPTETVKVCTNEDAVYRLRDAKEKGAPKEELAAIWKDIDAATYEIHMTGISQEKRDEASAAAEIAFPIKYETVRDPRTQAIQKQEVPSAERQNHENDLILAFSILKITAPDGSVDTAPGLAIAQGLRLQAPVVEFAKVHQAVIKLLTASVKFEDKVDATFPDGSTDVA
jgi:hypothetical protein